jgi:CHASE1-domain containing sensor protein
MASPEISQRSWITGRRGRCVVLLIVVAIGVGASLAAWAFLAAQQERLLTARFERSIDDRTAAMQEACQDVIHDLHAVAAFCGTSESISREQFQNFTAAILVRDDPATVALEWVPRIPQDQRAAHEAAMRVAGVAGYEITEPSLTERSGAAQRPVYYPLAYVEPWDQTALRICGTDFAAEPTRRQ